MSATVVPTAGSTMPQSSLIFGSMAWASHPGGLTTVRNSTTDLMNSYARVNQRQQEERSRNREEIRPRWRQSHGVWTTTETAQEADIPEPTREPEPVSSTDPELCCICMGEAANHRLEPCNHGGFCGTCAMLLAAGAVSDTPQCPLCRVEITGHHEVSDTTIAVATAASPLQPPADVVTSVEEAIAPDILNILRHQPPSTGSRMPRTTQLLRQLQTLRSSQANYFTQELLDYAWNRYSDNEEPLLLVDTGAKDGLCGDKWAIHTAHWAKQHGHKHQVGLLPERRTVCGVGAGSQHADESIRVPIGLEDKGGKHHLSSYKAAVIRNSSLPALLGLDSLANRNAVIQCKTGEIWFTDKQGCDIKPRGNHVHLQMVKSRHGDHWYLPIGRFNDVMTRLGEASPPGHLSTTSCKTACGNSSSSSAE